MTDPTRDEAVLYARYEPEWGRMMLCNRDQFGAVEYRPASAPAPASGRVDAVALSAAQRAYDAKLNDACGPYPTEHPDDGDGPMGYAIRAYLSAYKATLIDGIGKVELTEDGLSLRLPYDGDVDGDGRHVVVGGDIIATFEDSDAGEAVRDLLIASLSPAATPVSEAGGEPDMWSPKLEVIRLLKAEDQRQLQILELLETIREQVRLGVKPEHRPDGLMKNLQTAVYGLRGRMPLLNDAAIMAPLQAKPASSPAGSRVEQGLRARIDELLTEREFLTSVISKSHEPGCALWSDEPADCDCQASSPAGGDVREALAEAIEFADQDFHALTPAGVAMIERWRTALSQSTSAGRVGE
jgi:hypothetical protein